MEQVSVNSWFARLWLLFWFFVMAAYVLWGFLFVGYRFGFFVVLVFSVLFFFLVRRLIFDYDIFLQADKVVLRRLFSKEVSLDRNKVGFTVSSFFPLLGIYVLQADSSRYYFKYKSSMFRSRENELRGLLMTTEGSDLVF